MLKNANKTLLITGAFGLVGSNICKMLECDYPDVVVTKVKCDEAGPWIEQTYDYILHCAGYGQPLKFSQDKLKTIQINTELTDILLEMLKPDGKFLFISTSEVYSGAKSPYKETDIGTTTPQHPRACYIEGKRCGEAICMSSGRDVKIARLALAYGPGTKVHDTRVLNQFIEQALTTGKIVMKDKGEAIRTYGYVEDVADQLLKILFYGKDVVYNVGGVSCVTIKELADQIAEITKAEVVTGEQGLIGAPEDVQLDLSKVINEFGMEFTPITYGLLETINYQKKLYE